MIIEAGTVPVSNATTAEFTKLYENIFRHINIGYANEMALLANRMSLDIFEIIKACSTKPFGFMPFYPGPGIGGHCIPINPYYLIHAAETKSLNLKLVKHSIVVNDKMPLFFARKIIQIAKKNKVKRIGIMGVSFKKDIADTRESPAITIINELLNHQLIPEIYDPIAKEITVQDVKFHHISSFEKFILQNDIIVILVNHGLFENSKIKNAMNKAKKRIIINTTRMKIIPSHHVIYSFENI
jgi:UDP-N-acetyl-D-glucosamine dehydrogenase